MTGSIRELQKQKTMLLRQYHADNKALDEQIDLIRAKRGTKLKEPDDTGWVERGKMGPDRTPYGDR